VDGRGEGPPDRLYQLKILPLCFTWTGKSVPSGQVRSVWMETDVVFLGHFRCYGGGGRND